MRHPEYEPIKKAMSEAAPRSQRRFGEHVKRDESELRAHVDYIQWNPVKHGYVKQGKDRPTPPFTGLSRMAYIQKIGVVSTRQP
jgi:putative transposase